MVDVETCVNKYFTYQGSCELTYLSKRIRRMGLFK